MGSVNLWLAFSSVATRIEGQPPVDSDHEAQATQAQVIQGHSPNQPDPHNLYMCLLGLQMHSLPG